MIRQNEQSTELLKILTETPGVSGYETPVRGKISEYLSPLSCSLQTDHLGSLIAESPGKNEEPKIMLVAHMDEVGLMVTKITEEGFIKFQKLGGWWDPVLLNHKVQVLTANNNRVTGVVGAKAPHILTAEEKKTPITIQSMFVDIGVSSKEDAEALGIRSGDPIVPVSNFELFPKSKSFMAKALDDRAGCAMIIEIFRELENCNPSGTVFGVMTVQEEIGLRGAGTSVSVVKPDLAIVLDVTVATDTPDIALSDVVSKTGLGKGPVICFYDASMIPHIPFRDFVVNTAEENQIPYQIEIMPGGGTDAGKIHLYRQGIPSIVVGIPVRYIHDHIGIANLDDYHNAIKLVLELIKRLNSETMDQFIYKTLSRDQTNI